MTRQSGWSLWVALTLAAGAPTAQEPGPPAFAFRDGELARVVAAYKALPAKTDRSTFDVAALSAKIGGDPLTAFTFVRDHIADEIYPGVLRGAEGTLQAGAGNDLDRSLLLASLLSGASHRIRFARCTLGADLAESRVAAMFAPAEIQQRDDSVGAAFKTTLMEAGLSEARSVEIVAARQEARQWLRSAILRTAQGDLEVVRAALDRAGVTPGTSARDPRILEDAKDHYWLQVARGETWQDFDTAMQSAPPGEKLCVETETFEQVPDAAYQTLTLALRNQYIEGESLRDETVLRHRFKVSELYGEVITVVNVGVPGSGTQPEGARFERFIPFARTRNQVHVGSEFAAVAGVDSTAVTTLDAFGGGEDPPVLGAQWLDYVLEAPGRRLTGSRALVDLIAPAERHSRVIRTRPEPEVTVIALAQSAAIAVSSGVIHEVAAVERAYRDLDPAAVGRSFDTPLEPAPSVEPNEAEGVDPEGELLGGVALAYATHAERALADRGSADRRHVRLIRDQPMLTIANMALRRRTGGQALVAELAVDLRHDQVRVVPQSAAHAAPAFWANVFRGLVDGALEHHLPALTIRAAHQVSRGAVTQIDTSGLLRLARSQAIEVRAHSSRTTPNLHALIAEAGGIGIVGELGDSTAVVAPIRSVQVGDEQRFAMWTVDLTSGNLLSLLDTGLRGQMTEQGKLVRLINFLATQIRRCVASGGNMARCRQMFQLWADAANRLRQLRNLPGRITMNNGNFIGFTF